MKLTCSVTEPRGTPQGEPAFSVDYPAVEDTHLYVLLCGGQRPDPGGVPCLSHGSLTGTGGEESEEHEPGIAEGKHGCVSVLAHVRQGLLAAPLRDTFPVVISVIVPAYNEEFELPATLEAIRLAIAGEEAEVIVVDDGSTDTTRTVAAQLGARVVPIHRRQIAAARNAGARAAAGEILFFVDADTHIMPEHVHDGVTALQEGYVGGGALVSMRGELPAWADRVHGPFTMLYFRAFKLAAGAFLFTTRTNFERVRGFDESRFAGEEVFFSRALKKLGPFKLLEEPVHTSGRKLRLHSGRRILRQMLPLFLNPWATRSRRSLQLWYDGQRETA